MFWFVCMDMNFHLESLAFSLNNNFSNFWRQWAINIVS